MPQDPKRNSYTDFDAINPAFPPPSLKTPQNDSGKESDKRKKKDKKWSIGGLFRRKKKVSDTDSSSAPDDEEEKRGFLERRRSARKKRNRGSKDVTGSFEHVIISPPNRLGVETSSNDRSRSRERSSERLVGRSHESLSKRHQDTGQIRGSSVSLEGTGRRSGRMQIKARVEASRDRLRADSSSDEGGGSSRHSSSSVQKFRSDEYLGSKDGSLSKRTRAARTERYIKRLSRDEEGLRDFEVSAPTRVSRSDERLSGIKSDNQVPVSNRWTAKVVYQESSDYDTKYCAKTTSATPSPIQSPKTKPKNALHYTASAPSGATVTTFPPSHAREGVASSHQELRIQHLPGSIFQNVPQKTQRHPEITPPRVPKSDTPVRHLFPNSIQRHYPTWEQDALNRKSASFDGHVNNFHHINSQISQPHPSDSNILVVQFPLSRPIQKNKDTPLDSTLPKHLQHPLKQQNPPPPPPRDPHRRLLSSNGYQPEASPRPMSYAFEDRNQHQSLYPGFPDFSSKVSAFHKYNQGNPTTDFQAVPNIHKHHRSNSDHQLPSHIHPGVKSSPPMARRPASVQPEPIMKPYSMKHDHIAKSPPVEVSNVPPHYQYYTDQQPRSRKPIHIAYQSQKPINDPYLSDSQVMVKPPFQHVPRSRPLGVQSATDFWKQKEQECAKKVHLSNGSPKLMQKHFPNSVATDRSRSNSPHLESHVTKSKLRLPPLIMPVRGAESSGSLSSHSSPRDMSSPRSNPNLAHNEIGIPVFDSGDLTGGKRDNKEQFRPLSMVLEKRESSEKELSPRRDKSQIPPTPPTRRDSKVNAVTNFETFDVFKDDNEVLEGRRKSSNLEEALNELEAIYKSLRLGEEGYLERISKDQTTYENNRLDPSNWSAWVQSRGFESDSSFNYSRSSLESVDSVDSPLRRRTSVRPAGVPDRVTDDMAYRRLNKKDRQPPQEQQVISQAGSFLLVSPTLSPPPFAEPPPIPIPKNEPDITLDDVVYRNIKHVNNSLKVLDPQPPFGIPLGPITPAPNSDYLHVTPKEIYRPTFKPRKTPDVVTDDLAFRNLRKDNNKEPLFTPEDTTLIDAPALKKKRAVRSLSANLLSIIQKESLSLNNNKIMVNNNLINSEFEKSQSFTDLADVLNSENNVELELTSQPRKARTEESPRRNLSGEDSDATPRVSRFYPGDTSSVLVSTSTETLTDSRTNLLNQESKTRSQKMAWLNNGFEHHLPPPSSPRLSLTPERKHFVDELRLTPSPIPAIKSLATSTSRVSPSFRKATCENPPPLSSSHKSIKLTLVNKERHNDQNNGNQTETDLLAILAREAKETSEQLGRELDELTEDKKEQNPPHIDTTKHRSSEDSFHADESPFHGKSSSIGKIVAHKPVKLNTFYITEDNVLENRQTVVTNKPVEIEGSKSMTDLLKELTRSLDYDFGTLSRDQKEDSKSVTTEDMDGQSGSEIIPVPTEEEEESSVETKSQEILDERTSSKEREEYAEERNFECIPEIHNNASSLVFETTHDTARERTLITKELEETKCQIPKTEPLFCEVTISPTQITDDSKQTLSPFVKISHNSERQELNFPVSSEVQTRTEGSSDKVHSIPSDPRGSRAPEASRSMDCSNFVDEGTKLQASSSDIADPRTLLLICSYCMACAHQLAGLECLTLLGIILAMASFIIFLNI